MINKAILFKGGRSDADVIECIRNTGLGLQHSCLCVRVIVGGTCGFEGPDNIMTVRSADSVVRHPSSRGYS